MSKPSRSGVRGLFKELRYFDTAGKLVRKAEAVARIKAGEKLAKEERYYIDLRWKDPKTGKQDRHTERLPDNISAAAAKTRALEIMNSAKAGTFEKDAAAPKRFHEALDAYLVWSETNRPQTHKTRTSVVSVLKAAITDRPLSELAPFDLERFKRDREKSGSAPATINRNVSHVKRMFTLAVEWGWCSREQLARIRSVSKLKEPPGRVRYLTPDEEGKLFAKLKSTMLALVTAADMLGMRRTELVLLRKDAVDLQRGNITLRKTKSNRVRVLPISEDLAPILTAALARSPEGSEYVFTQQKGKSRGKPYRPASVTQAFKRTVKKAKITNLKLHDIRHDFATKVRRSGVGIDVIKELLGHSNISVTMRYAHVEPTLLRAAVAGLKAPIASPLPDSVTDGRSKRAKKLAI